MRIKSCEITFVLTIFCLAVMTVPVFAESLIQANPESVNFGQVEQGETAIARFQLLNTGSQALTIQWMEFSQPGLIAQVQPQIGVGASVEVLVNWNTGSLLGDIEGQITLGLNDPENPEIVLTLSGTVIPTTETPPEVKD